MKNQAILFILSWVAREGRRCRGSPYADNRVNET